MTSIESFIKLPPVIVDWRDCGVVSRVAMAPSPADKYLREGL